MIIISTHMHIIKFFKFKKIHVKTKLMTISVYIKTLRTGKKIFACLS